MPSDGRSGGSPLKISLRLVSLVVVALLATSFLPTPLQGQRPAGPIAPDSKSYRKLDSGLAQRVIAAKATGVAGPSGAGPDAPTSAPETVRVIIESDPASIADSAVAAIGLGATVEVTYDNLIQVAVPVSALEAISSLKTVSYVRRPMTPVPQTVTSEGVSLINANNWQTAGLTGAGVKVGILDIEFQNYASLLGTELPAVVQTHWAPSLGGPGTGVHGTACAEIIHDIAPNAQLFLANAGTEAELGDAVDWLIAQDVDIISHSVGWYISAGDGTGIVDSIVDRARAAGITWVNAAGNDAQRHWAGTWTDTDNDAWVDFSASVEGLPFNNMSSIAVYLRWDDTWDRPSKDYDIYLFPSSVSHPTLEINPATQTHYYVAWSDSPQNPINSFDHPTEQFQYSTPGGVSGNYYIAIYQYSNAGTNVNFDLFTPENFIPSFYRVAPYSLSTPADSPNAIAVGAVNWTSPATIEAFSSQGPTRDGRPKPDISGPDGVLTASYGSAFFGTSAAAPHVSGAAALVKQAYPSYTPAQIQTFLEGRAVDLGTAGKDSVFGSGRLQLGNPAIAPVANFHASATTVFAGTQINFTDDSTNTPTSWAWDFDNNGTIESTAQNPSYTYNVAGNYTVKLTATNSAGSDPKTKSNYITVNPAALHHITVTPSSQTLAAGGTQAFTAAGFDQYNNAITPLTVAWSMADATAGSINAGTGSFTAGSAPGTYANAVTATSGAVTGTASVTVTVGALHHITVSPSNPIVLNGGSQNFTAVGYDQFDNAVAPLTFAWSVTNATAGSINPATGVFSGSVTAGVYSNVVHATSGVITGEASVTILPAIDHITVSPPNPSVQAGSTQSYSAAAYDSQGGAIGGLTFAWSVTNPVAGTINPTTGVFTAAGVLGEYTNVIEASVGGATGTSSATIVLGPLHHVAVTPVNPAIPLSGSWTFFAQGYDAYDNAIDGLVFSWSVTNSSVGSINATTALFTPVTRAGTFSVIQATSGGVSGIGSITILPGPVDHISVTPQHPTVVSSTQQAFSATAYDEYNNAISSAPIVWSLTNAAAGSINAGTGVFTATANSNNFGDFIDVARATSGTIYGQASVNIVAPGTAVLNGSVTLQGGSRPPAGRIQELTVRLFAPGASDTALKTGAGALVTYGPPIGPMTQDTGGNTVVFQIAVETPGTYDITVVYQGTLVNVKKGIVLGSGSNTIDFGTLREGDSNFDGIINALDFSTLSSSYMKSFGQPGFNATADFDKNGVVNALDMSLMAANYMLTSPRVI